MSTPQQLQEAEARYQRALRLCETERDARNAVVRDALAAGMTHAAIAKALAKSRGRVGQLAMEAKP